MLLSYSRHFSLAMMATDTVVVRRAELLFECCRHTIELWFNSVSGTTQLRSSCPGVTKAMGWWSLLRCIKASKTSTSITEYYMYVYKLEDKLPFLLVAITRALRNT